MQQYKKWEDILSYTAILWVLVLVNILSNHQFFRIDLTEEKRFSITEASKSMLGNLSDDVYVDVYLDGDLNAGFRRLKRSIKEQLEEFRIYSDGKVQYRFINLDEIADPKEKAALQKQLAQKGVPPTTLYDNIDGKRTQKVIFPGAVISSGSKEEGVLLLKGNKASSAQEQLNQSVEGVEYELATAIRKVAEGSKPSIAFVTGQDELTPMELSDITQELEQHYLVDWVGLDSRDLDAYSALIIAQPKSAFSDIDKFRLDQYIMRGGSAMFFLDNVQMNIDSIAMGGTYAFGYDLNITDLLFKYGVRVNLDLLLDQQAGMIDVVTGNIGNKPNVQQLPWPYYIYFNTYGDHPIVKGLDVIYSKFPSSIDTIRSSPVKKTPLVLSSQYAKVKPAPTMVDLNELKADLDPKQYSSSHVPVAYLLEGEFKSFYAASFAPREAKGEEILRKSQPTKVIVFADGDILKSELDKRTGKPMPIDYDRVRRQRLANKEFMVNALAYLTDGQGLILSRNKEITLRPLDAFRLKEEKLKWQIINLALPILLIIAFGIARFFWRKKRFS